MKVLGEKRITRWTSVQTEYGVMHIKVTGVAERGEKDLNLGRHSEEFTFEDAWRLAAFNTTYKGVEEHEVVTRYLPVDSCHFGPMEIKVTGLVSDDELALKSFGR